MNKINTKAEKKAYIKRTWGTSSGQRIKEMLLRYWNLKDNTLEKTMETAKGIFK